jgi:hypothetical protein
VPSAPRADEKEKSKVKRKLEFRRAKNFEAQKFSGYARRTRGEEVKKI